MSIQSVRIRQILFPGDASEASLAQRYADVFSKHPYYEIVSPEDVIKDVIHPHIKTGERSGHCVFVIEEEGHQGRVIGFGMCHGAMTNVEPVIREFLISNERDFPFHLDRAVFMSELGVHEDYRNCRLGRLLILKRFAWAQGRGYTHYVMRTAEEDSYSAGIYSGLGAKPIPTTQEVLKAIAGGTATASRYRTYLYGALPPPDVLANMIQGDERVSGERVAAKLR